MVNVLKPPGYDIGVYNSKVLRIITVMLPCTHTYTHKHTHTTNTNLTILTRDNWQIFSHVKDPRKQTCFIFLSRDYFITFTLILILLKLRKHEEHNYDVYVFDSFTYAVSAVSAACFLIG